jgi:hypothetical protein
MQEQEHSEVGGELDATIGMGGMYEEVVLSCTWEVLFGVASVVCFCRSL